jgi:hypothetical protein
MTYSVVVLDDELAAGVRATLTAPDYGHPAHAEVADDDAPCRVCLGRFEPGEERRLLFTYDPFRGDTFPLPGPVFIHADGCAPHPAAEPLPETIAGHPITLVAYARGRRQLGEYRVDGRTEVERQAGELFADDAVDYVHVRSTNAGCFICRLDRQPGRRDRDHGAFTAGGDC